MTGRWTRGALSLGAIALVAAALASTAAARVDARGSAKATSVNVAFIYPKTGGLAGFGEEGFWGVPAGPAYTTGKSAGDNINTAHTYAAARTERASTRY